MNDLPFGLDIEDEISIDWERDDLSTKVRIVLGESSVTIDATPDAAEQTLPWLLNNLPMILDRAWDAIEQQEEA